MLKLKFILVALITMFSGNYSYHLNNYKVENAVLNDATFNKTTNNISVYFIQRNGAVIALQTLLSVCLTVENQNKTVYIFLAPSIKNTDAIGTINFNSLVTTYSNLHFGRSQHNEYINDQDLAPVINILQSQQLIDLYVEDYYPANIHPDSIVNDLATSWTKIHTITFTTDGNVHFAIEQKTANFLNGLSASDKQHYTKMWDEIFNGKPLINFLSADLKQASLFLPNLMSLNADGTRKINSWVITSQMYDENPNLNNSWNSVGVGFFSAWNQMSAAYQNSFLKAYNLDNYDLSYTSHHNNIIYAGSLMNGSTTTVLAEAQVISKRYEEFKVGSTNSNIIYKPHPREVANNLIQLTNEVKRLTNNKDDWFHILKQEVPLEIFPLTNKLVANNDTFFHYLIFGTSTSVQSLYSVHISNEIEQFIFPNQKDYEIALSWYGENSTILDFKKSFIEGSDHLWFIIGWSIFIGSAVVILIIVLINISYQDRKKNQFKF